MVQVRTPNSKFLIPHSPFNIERLLDALPRPQRPYKTRFLGAAGRHAATPCPRPRQPGFRAATTPPRPPRLTAAASWWTIPWSSSTACSDPTLFFRLNRPAYRPGAGRAPAAALLRRQAAGGAEPAPTGEVLVSKEKSQRREGLAGRGEAGEG
ncbi:MAG: hypothetical protein WKG07_14955 [Hymenobacter sp.]